MLFFFPEVWTFGTAGNVFFASRTLHNKAAGLAFVDCTLRCCESPQDSHTSASGKVIFLPSKLFFFLACRTEKKKKNRSEGGNPRKAIINISCRLKQIIKLKVFSAARKSSLLPSDSLGCLETAIVSNAAHGDII